MHPCIINNATSVAVGKGALLQGFELYSHNTGGLKLVTHIRDTVMEGEPDIQESLGPCIGLLQPLCYVGLFISSLKHSS